MTREEIRNKLLSLFSANFNDGENIEERVGSKDMYSVSSIVEFIDDYVVPYTAEKVLEAQVAAAKYFIDEVWGSDNPDEIYPKLVAKYKTLQAELAQLKEED